MAVEPGSAVALEVRVAARPETVFPFFTKPELMLRWKGVQAELEPVAGGTYRVVMNDEATVRGEYLEVVPPSRVVFSWGFEGEDPLVAPGASVVEVTLTPDGDGTIVRLVHRDLPAAARERHEEGWQHTLGRLVEALSSSD